MPNSAQTRREPQKGKNGFSTHKGFTIIEVLIAIAVVAIVASLALPSYRTIIEKRQVTSGAEQIGAFMSAVQMEAVKRSENISVNYQTWGDDGDGNALWCLGMTNAIRDEDDPYPGCDCRPEGQRQGRQCLIEGIERVLVYYGDPDEPNGRADISQPTVINSMVGDNDFYFDPARGLVLDDETTYDTAEIVLVSEETIYGLIVQLGQTGRVKYCTNDIGSKQVPGYSPCS